LGLFTGVAVALPSTHPADVYENAVFPPTGVKRLHIWLIMVKYCLDGQLAQLVEHYIDIVAVDGSNPLLPTIRLLHRDSCHSIKLTHSLSSLSKWLIQWSLYTK
jgi:hypothetical protein